ncbi:hypothetical protein BDV97DRAFT_157316 [Delphinella strobiligena]|nr:hypothetical protein BDV97DRAFT_157316 [Delphinella strobiligena]
MAPENSNLDAKYNILRLNVISSNSIQSRTISLVKHLRQESTGRKTAIASLRAKASVANKLISAIEIAKRDLSQINKKVYQYNALTSETVNVKSPKTRVAKGGQPGNEDGDGDKGDAAAEEEDEAFEPLEQKDETEEVPVLTIYLSLVSIKELRDAHGEQTA